MFKIHRGMRGSFQNSRNHKRHSLHDLQHTRLLFETLESRQLLSITAQISEFMAINKSTLMDADGDYSDWIEIHNITASPVNLNNWSLTDDPGAMGKWHFPAVTLGADGYLKVFASGKNRAVAGSELHTNFQLNGDGEYLALAMPDGTAATQYAPYPAQHENVSYGITTITTSPLVTESTLSKTLVPTNDSLGQTWTSPTFSDSTWRNGYLGVGYDLNTTPQPVAYWNFDETSGLAAADSAGYSHTGTLVNGPTWVGGHSGNALSFNGSNQYVSSTVDLSEGAYTVSLWFKTTSPNGGLFAAVDGTLGANGDDRDIYLSNGNIVTRVWNNQVLTTTGLNLADGQWHHVVHTMSGSTYGQQLFVDGVFKTGGSKNTSDFTWQTGAVIGFANDASSSFFNGQIDEVAVWSSWFNLSQVVSLYHGSSPLGYSQSVKTNIASSMRSVNTSAYVRIPFTVDAAAEQSFVFRMRYDDGFVAWLNGVEIARRNAPAVLSYNSAATTDRAKTLAMAYEEILLPAGIISQTGTNVLAIQGLSSSLDSNEFLILPQILQVQLAPVFCYMTSPTPGSANGEGSLGYVADTKFSVDRGFYNAPISVAITCDTPGAKIRYTTDGSTPTATTGSIYSAPLTISSTTVLRAAAFLANYEPGNVDTQTYIFTADVKLQSSSGSPPAGWPTGPINGQVLDYGMDPNIVNNSTWGPQIEAALKAIPSFSIVTDKNNLFNASTGIYVNPYSDGSDWERPASVELIYPDGTTGFQIDAGIRVRGGYSRSTDNPKHAFRILFRSEYGAGELDYPLFGDDGAKSFENIDLRCSQNYSWSFGGDPNNAVVRDIFSRDLMDAMGEPTSHGQPYFLYIDGQFWGLYETDERPEAEFGATYMGGTKEDYDVIKVDTSGYVIYATDGTVDAWQNLWNLANAGLASNAAYNRVLGKNADGTRNPAYPVYVDQNNLIDYMITIFYSGNLDAPVSAFLGNTNPNNFYAIYNRTNPTGFKFVPHDSEHTLAVVGDTNRALNFPAGDSFSTSNPQWLHQQLMANPEYRQAFADRVQKYFFNGGILTPAGAQAIYQARANQISLAIIAESARWGDAKTEPPLTKTNWQNAVNNDLNWMTTRTATVLSQLMSTTLRNGTAAPLFPNVAAPIFSQRGGANQSSYSFSLSAAAGTIYYTLDGSDPRLPGGGVSASAQVFSGSTTNVTLTPQGATWKFLDNGTNQGTAWRATGFSDSSWKSGSAQLGYGDGDEATTVGYIDTDSGITGVQKNATTYFRKTFTITNPSLINGLTLDLLADDGAVVYINGQEVVRRNMPTGTIAYDTWASGVVSGADESTNFYTYTISPSVLVSGVNTIAVEIHQCSNDSSDISFDLRLNATQTNSLITINNTTLVKTRALSGSTWSAIDQAQFIVDAPASISNLVVSELHYNPPEPSAAELLINPLWTGSDFEYLELKNTSAAQIDLTNVKIALGVTFDFTGSSVTKVAPGDYVLVVKNPAAFQSRYGTAKLGRIAGTYAGSLSNGGETLTIVDRLNANICSFAYGDSGAWPGRADGSGSSLELVDPAAVPTTPTERTAYLQTGSNWSASREFGGSPAATGTGPITTIVVNEVLAHTDLPMVDSIELYNTTSAPIDIGGWYLSDDTADYQVFRFPAGTVLGAHEYRVFTENDFGFRLDAAYGEDIWLLSADAAGKPAAFVEHAEFGAVANGESLGRWPDGTGKLYPLKNRTLGEPNNLAGNGPRVGPLLISEVMYKPSVSVGQIADDFEYIEIFNPTNSAVALDNWKLSKGVDYSFAAGTSIAAHEALVVLSFNPADPLNAAKLAAFKAKYNVAATVKLVGGFAGHLDDDGETVQLNRPDEVEAGTIPPFYPSLTEDEIAYSATAPWPSGASGGGSSLQRLGLDRWGDDAASWTTAAPVLGSAMMMVATAGDWTATGLTLKIGTDGKLHLYRTGTTTDAVPPQAPANVTAVYVTGRDADDDMLTVDFTGGNPIPSGGLSYDGGLLGTGSGNTLALVATAADDSAVLNSSQAILNGGTPITYSNVAFFAFDLGGGVNTLLVDHATLGINRDYAISDGTKVTVDGGLLDFHGHADQIGNLTLLSNGQAIVGAIDNAITTVASGTLTAGSIHCDTLVIGSTGTAAASTQQTIPLEANSAAAAKPLAVYATVPTSSPAVTMVSEMPAAADAKPAVTPIENATLASGVAAVSFTATAPAVPIEVPPMETMETMATAAIEISPPAFNAPAVTISTAPTPTVLVPPAGLLFEKRVDNAHVVLATLPTDSTPAEQVHRPSAVFASTRKTAALQSLFAGSTMQVSDGELDFASLTGMSARKSAKLVEKAVDKIFTAE